jgi:hypothetical protein
LLHVEAMLTLREEELLDPDIFGLDLSSKPN